MSLKTKPIEVTNNLKAKVLMKNWLSNQDIMILAECGLLSQVTLKEISKSKYLLKDLNYREEKVPKKEFLNYLGIEKTYIFQTLAQTEQKAWSC